MSPLCVTYPSALDLTRGEVYYPLHAYVCEQCFLVQLGRYEGQQPAFPDSPGYPIHFGPKPGMSHCDGLIARFGLDRRSLVVEVGRSSDSHLAKFFAARNVRVIGVEPKVEKVATAKGVRTLVQCFGKRLARELTAAGHCADLVIANNVLTNVPDINDFVGGLKTLLKPRGVLGLEFPHLLRLITHNEFGMICHESFSYFSLLTAIRVLEAHGLRAFDVDATPAHGNSLRVYACRAECEAHPSEWSVAALIEEEKRAGLDSLQGYEGFSSQVQHSKLAFMEFLLIAARLGKSVAGYGATSKAATLLHYCGVGKDLVEYIVDSSPDRQGRLLPGAHIPICDPERIGKTKPQYVVILSISLKDEIMKRLQFIRGWGGRFVVATPQVTTY